MCTSADYLLWSSLQQTSGVISVDEGVRFDELRFSHKTAGSLPEAPENICLLIAQAMHLKAT